LSSPLKKEFENPLRITVNITFIQRTFAAHLAALLAIKTRLLSKADAKVETIKFPNNRSCEINLKYSKKLPLYCLVYPASLMPAVIPA
jgi:hypothetical protein